MKDAEIRRMAEMSRRHFWFLGTRAVILDWARRAAGRPLAELTIGDVGCGPGTTLEHLPPEARIVGLDLSPLALSIAAERTPEVGLAAADAERLPLADGVLDLAFSLDILEHLDHPDAAAAELFRVLKPGGALIATVPAWKHLFSTHDIALDHKRRYRKPGFQALLGGAGFEIERMTYFNVLLYPPVAAIRWWRRDEVARAESGEQLPQARSDLRKLPGWLNAALAGVLASERFLLRAIDVPLGVSLIAWAKKPG